MIRYTGVSPRHMPGFTRTTPPAAAYGYDGNPRPLRRHAEPTIAVDSLGACCASRAAKLNTFRTRALSNNAAAHKVPRRYMRHTHTRGARGCNLSVLHQVLQTEEDDHKGYCTALGALLLSVQGAPTLRCYQGQHSRGV